MDPQYTDLEAGGRRLLTLRSLSRLTQVELARRVGVSKYSILKWEGGESSPNEANLRKLIAVFVAQGAFAAGQEREEAEALWESIRRQASTQLPAFDERWFGEIRRQETGDRRQEAESRRQETGDRRQETGDRRQETAVEEQAAPILDPRSSILDPQSTRSPAHPFTRSPALLDWGEAIDVPALYGREAELATLQQWVLGERCRTVALLGLGGMGKTSLALTFARQALPHFEVVLFRSLRNAPPAAELCDQLIRATSAQQTTLPDSTHDKITTLINLLRARRCLLVLDNLETIIQAGTQARQYRAGYADYGALIERISVSLHQSCLLLTSREKPAELEVLEGYSAPVRSLMLAGLAEPACLSMLADKHMFGAVTTYTALVRLYGGNPLALKLVSEPIHTLFGGDVQAFLDSGEAFFNGVGKLLEQQLVRSTPLEQALLFWLAIERELVSLRSLPANLAGPAQQHDVRVALESLGRRSLIERGGQGAAFTLQPVVLEYLTEQLVEQSAAEIIAGQPALLLRYALVQAMAKEYVRHSQEQLIAQPLLKRLLLAYRDADTLEQQLMLLLAAWRGLPPLTQGYGPGTIINLLRLLRGHLRGLDLARLAIRQAYLQGVDMQDASLAEATVQDSLFTETFDAMTAVAASSTGAYWAASSRRGEVLVWSASSQMLHQSWHAHADMIWTLTFSPDGSMLASGSWDGAVKLWDAASGTLRWAGSHTSRINTVAFSPDGSRLASAGLDATVKLWTLGSDADPQTLPHSGPISVVAWSPDGRLLAVGSVEGSIWVWELRQAEPTVCTLTLAGHTSWVDGLVFAPDGGTLASASWDGTVKLWDVSSGHLRETLTGHTDRVHSLAWSPDGQTLASCSRDRLIWLWDVVQGSYRTALQGHAAGVNRLAFTADSQSLLSGGEDGTLRVWDIASEQCVRVIQGYAVSLYDIDWSPDGSLLASGGTDYLVTIYDVAGDELPRLLRGHSGIVYSMAWSPDGRWLASSEWDNRLLFWRPSTDAEPLVLQAPDDTGDFLYGVAWSPDGTRLASGTLRRGAQVWDVAAQRPAWTGHQFPAWIRQVVWSPDSTRLAGAGDDGSVYIWDAAGGQLLQRLTGHQSMVARVAWSPDGTQLASGGSAGDELFVWDVRRGERVHAFVGHTGMVSAVAWGPSADLLISGDGDGTLRWWDVPRGECIHIHKAHTGTVQALRRSPGATQLASCGDDGAIMLWELPSGRYLRTLRRDRPYERMNISGLSGITDAQRAALLALGAVELEDRG